MKQALLGLALFGAAAAVGAAFQSPPYRIDAPGRPADQVALDHRDSVYTSITWIASPGDNGIEMRFFDRVEGGICLSPTWPDLVAMAAKDPSLKHLVPDKAEEPLPGNPKLWPKDLPPPNPGTLTHTKYVNLYPIGLLLNDGLMKAAGDDYRQCKPKIVIVGLGSGVGMAVFAHHFPNASITVVDIDQVVIDMVKERYPLLRWLSTQKTSDGRPRMRFVARDARQYMRFEGKAEAATDPFDLVVLDAYTAGSTIPPHLMTVKFFEECMAVLSPTGMIQANVIGSYTGRQHKVVGGAIRAFRAAGLENVHSFPVLQPYEVGKAFNQISMNTRNNLVIAARTPIAPRGPGANAAGWERLAKFVPYPGMPLDTYVSRKVVPYGENISAASLHWSAIEAVQPGLFEKFTSSNNALHASLTHLTVRECRERAVIDAVAQAGRAANPKRVPFGWDALGGANLMYYEQIDWVRHNRDAYTLALAAARDVDYHSGDALVGPIQGDRSGSLIPDAPLFTDQRANADIYNSE